jgi:hypothetical protein
MSPLQPLSWLLHYQRVDYSISVTACASFQDSVHPAGLFLKLRILLKSRENLVTIKSGQHEQFQK